MSKETTRITVDVPNQMHRLIKTYATFSDTNMKEYIIEAVKDKMKKEENINIPNKKTLLALEQSMQDEKNGKLHSYNNVQDLLDEVKK